MTAPIRPAPKSLDGRSTRELVSFERTGVNGEPPPTPAGSGGVADVDLVIAHPGNVTALNAQPSAETDYWPGTPWFDTRAFNQMRVVIDNVETAGHTTSRVIAKCASTVGGTFAAPGVAGAEVAAAIATTGPQKSAQWAPLDTTAIGDRLWKALAVGGNGSLTPVVGGVHFQFRQAAASRPPVGTPGGDLPEDATWGNILFDANAPAAAMAALYNDGDDVANFLERLGDNLTTVATTNLPKYRATGLNGHPCVEFGGLSPHLAAGNPTQAYGIWTYYFVISELDGGDYGAIWGDVSEPPSAGYRLSCTSSNVYGHANNLFNGDSANVADDWGMSTPHIYRWTKPGTSWQLFVDGVHKVTGGAGPGPTGSATVGLMQALGGLGIVGKIGRVVAYDKYHVAPDGSNTTADGLTAPELVLQAYWGTP